jgi:5-methyltetrahydropteroyltriglutamate--homocysteine methyltransferase
LAEHGRVLFRDVIEAEEEDGRRIIVQQGDALSFVPYFARYPYETYIAPRETHASLADLSGGELVDLAEALRRTLVRMDNLWRMSFPYVMVLHQAPTDGAAYPGFHFHIQIHPPLRKPGLLKYLGGPEVGAGNFLNDTAPEEKAAELRAVEDAAIRDVVRMQEEAGLQGVTDGEFRRGSWHMDFLYQIGGVAKSERTLRIQFRNESGPVEAALGAFHIAGKLRLDRTIFAEDFSYLKRVAPAGTVAKLTIPSPSMLHYRGGRAVIDEAAYPQMEAFWDDLAEVYAREIFGLAALGCTYLQLDDTSLAYLNDPTQRAYVDSIGGDGGTQHLTNIRLINQALANKPEGTTVCTHMCRGNFRSSWVAEGGYDHVAEALFGELAVDAFFLEYDDARSGGFSPLRFVPRGKKRVVLGLVTTKRPALEQKDELKRRIAEAAKYVPLEQLCLSPQCGFSSTVDGNALTIDEQKAKLRLVAEVARDVWGN